MTASGTASACGIATASACARGSGDGRGFRVDRARRRGTRRGRRALARRASPDLTTPARGARRVPSRRATPRATRAHAPNVSAPPKSSSRFHRPSRPCRRDASRADGECPTRRFAGRNPPRCDDSALRREPAWRAGAFISRWTLVGVRLALEMPSRRLRDVRSRARAMVGTILSNHRSETDPLHGRPRRLMRFIRVRTRHPSTTGAVRISTPSGPARGRPRP